MWGLETPDDTDNKVVKISVAGGQSRWMFMFVDDSGKKLNLELIRNYPHFGVRLV